MHSSSVSTRPVTWVDGWGGVCAGAAGAGGCGGAAGVCARAAPVNTRKTQGAIVRSAATARGRDIGTRGYHARPEWLDTSRWTIGGCPVDTFFLDGR